MRCSTLFLIALTWGTGYCDSNFAGPATGPYVKFTSVAVSPTAVHAGNQFGFSASITYGNCDNPAISVSYDNGADYTSTPLTSLQGAFTAVLNQTTVSFDAACFPAGGGSAVARADEPVTIQVLP